MRALLPALFLLLLLPACDRSDVIPSSRDSLKAEATPSPPRVVNIRRRSDTIPPFDTTELKRIVLEHAIVTATIDRWVAGNLDDDPQPELIMLVTIWPERTGGDQAGEPPRFFEHLMVLDSSIAGAAIIHDDTLVGIPQGATPRIGIFNKTIRPVTDPTTHSPLPGFAP